ncbi:HEPN domain-containing protein [Candidatus Woesearchaeota archaeon]|nr:HEPN domain-containing protein [Candidatus Woesearchaeota archaeon]
MNLEECFEKGLLKKDIESEEKARKSVETARHKLDIAKRTFDAKIYEETIVNGYAAMFHAARALLFRDGIREKSHYGLYVYVKERYKYKLEPRLINELNTLRLERHELLYGLEKVEVKEVEAEDILKIAEDFIDAVEASLRS